MSRLLDPSAFEGKLWNGGWQPAGGGVLEVDEPATGRLLARVGRADAADVDRAVRTARRAQPAWAATPATERAAVLRRAAQLLEQHTDEVAGWLIRESGSTRGKAQFEVGSVLDELWTAAGLPTQPQGSLLQPIGARQSLARRIPLGVVGVISPWNVPMLLGLRAVAPALALGNAVLLKPDAQTPVSGGFLAARLFQEAGLPDGILQVLPGDAEAGAALAAHRGVDMIAFTGSTAVGREVGAVAGRDLKRVSLELGGNNALIVLDDADLDAASSAGAFASFFHQGQVCMATSRHIVLASVAEAYVDRLVKRAEQLQIGDPHTADVDLGPLINRTQLARVERIVKESVRLGARVRCGGTHEDLFFRPTVLSEVTAAMPAFQEEIFGPVAPVIVVADEDEAVRVANDTDYGLVAAVQTGSAQRGLALADRLQTAIVHVNDQTINDDAWVPFGGRGASGNGSRYGAEHSLDEFTQWQWITVAPQAGQFPF